MKYVGHYALLPKFAYSVYYSPSSQNSGGSVMLETQVRQGRCIVSPTEPLEGLAKCPSKWACKYKKAMTEVEPH